MGGILKSQIPNPKFQIRLHSLSSRLSEWWRDDSLTFDWKAGLACIVGGLLLAPLAYLLPMSGWNWLRCFHDPANPCGEVPWVAWIIPLLSKDRWRAELAVVNGLTAMTAAVSVAREARNWRDRALCIAMAIVNPFVFILAWVGQIDALGLLGLMLMPLGAPLMLAKPHVLGWAALSRKGWALIAVFFLALSFVVWGWWTPHVASPGGMIRTSSPIAMGWGTVGWHVLVIGLVMLVFTRRDPIQLAAVGALLTPYLLPYHLVVLLPALGRVNGWRRWALWGAAWLAGLTTAIWVYHIAAVPGFGLWQWSDGPEPWYLPLTRHLGLIFPVMVWGFLRAEARNP